MTMELPPEALSPPRGRKSWRKLALASLILLFLVAIVVVLIAPRPSNDKFSWLTPAQLAEAANGGFLGRVKARLRWVITPFRRFFRPKVRTLLTFKANFFALPAGSVNSFDLGTNAPVSSDGKRAWILSESELASFQDRLKNTRDVTRVSSPTMSTVDGVRSRMSIGNTVPVGGTMAFVGLSVDLFPKLKGESFKLLIGATSTATNTSSPPILVTNFSIGCQASIPNSGALVIDAGNSGTNHYLMVFLPQLTDANGKPIKR